MFGPLEPEQLEKKPGAGAAQKKKIRSRSRFHISSLWGKLNFGKTYPIVESRSRMFLAPWSRSRLRKKPGAPSINYIKIKLSGSSARKLQFVGKT